MPATSPEALRRKALRKRARRIERERERGIVRSRRVVYIDPAADRDEPVFTIRTCRPAWRIR